ncbi:AGAP005235-PA-like protein [Anopheles sinensis]|uniref:AGAP005235-PA-like protein n=1 Tax=Anopheles sinensis TaxID=74873 RepID=A0A084WRY0_ANOSI|nr:AGAP005235-PA-like protein [Anopheles sinensis]
MGTSNGHDRKRAMKRSHKSGPKRSIRVHRAVHSTSRTVRQCRRRRWDGTSIFSTPE